MELAATADIESKLSFMGNVYWVLICLVALAVLHAVVLAVYKKQKKAVRYKKWMHNYEPTMTPVYCKV